MTNGRDNESVKALVRNICLNVSCGDKSVGYSFGFDEVYEMDSNWAEYFYEEKEDEIIRLNNSGE